MWVLKFRTLKSKKDNAFKQRFSDPHTYYLLLPWPFKDMYINRFIIDAFLMI